MKRPLIVLISLVVVIALVLVGATFVMGMLTEKAVNSYSAQIEESPTMSALNLEVAEYERGFGKSTFSSHLTAAGSESVVSLNHEVYHGPFAFTPDGAKPGYSYIISTLDLDSLPEAFREEMRSVYGDAEPFTIKTTLKLDGDRHSILTVTAVDHETEDMTVRFEGGTIEVQGNGAGSEASGNIQFSPLRVKFNEVGEAKRSFRLRSNGSNATFSMKGQETISIDGEVKEIEMKSSGAGSGAMKVDSVKLVAEYAPIQGVEDVEGILTGHSSITVNSFEIESDDFGKFITSGLKIASKSSNEPGNLMKSEVTYGAEGFRAEMADQTVDTEWLKLMESGAEIVISGTVPHEVVKEFSKFQQEQAGMTATPEALAEYQIALADTMEATLRKLNKGTAVGLGARFGPKEGGVNVNFDLGYGEERPITSRKSYAELLNALELTLSASVPKTMLDEAPGLEEQIRGMKATGTIKETLNGYETTLTAIDGAVKVNGEPNPMFEQMAPILMTEIPWESLFEGMRAAAEMAAEIAGSEEDQDPDGQ